MPGPLEIGLILLVVLLVFGAKRIPEIARGVGKGIREFKDATNDIKNEIEREGTQQRVEPRPPRQGDPQSRDPQSRDPQSRDQARNAQREPAHQEAGRPASSENGPPEPSRADNPGEE